MKSHFRSSDRNSQNFPHLHHSLSADLRIMAVSTIISDVQIIGEYQNRGVEEQLRRIIKKLLCDARADSLQCNQNRGNRSNNSNRVKMNVGRKLDTKLINLFNSYSEKKSDEKKQEIEENTGKFLNAVPPGLRSGVCGYKNLKQTSPPASLEIWQSLTWSSPSSPHPKPPTRPSTEEIVEIKIDRKEAMEKVQLSRDNESSNEQKNVECEKKTSRIYPINFLL